MQLLIHTIGNKTVYLEFLSSPSGWRETLLIGLCVSPIPDLEFPTGPSQKHALVPNFMSNSYSHVIVDMINTLIFGYHHSCSQDI